VSIFNHFYIDFCNNKTVYFKASFSIIKQKIASAPKVAKITDQPPIPFTITPDSLENIREVKTVPDFKIRLDF